MCLHEQNGVKSHQSELNKLVARLSTETRNPLWCDLPMAGGYGFTHFGLTFKSGDAVS